MCFHHIFWLRLQATTIIIIYNVDNSLLPASGRNFFGQFPKVSDAQYMSASNKALKLQSSGCPRDLTGTPSPKPPGLLLWASNQPT